MYSKLPSDRLREIHQQFFGILFSDEFRRIHYMFKTPNSWFWYMLFCFGPRANNIYIERERDIPFGCFRILGARCPVRWVLPCWPSDFALWLVWPFWPNMWFSGPTGTWKSWQIGSWIDWNHALSMVFVCFVNFLKQPRGLLIQGWHYMTFPHFYNVSNLCWLVMFVSRIILATFLFKHQGFDKSIPPEMWNRGVHMVLPHHL